MFISVAFLIAHSLSIRKSAWNAFDGYSVWNEAKIVYINIIQELSKLSRKCHTAFIRSSFLTSKETFSLSIFHTPLEEQTRKYSNFSIERRIEKGTHSLSLNADEVVSQSVSWAANHMTELCSQSQAYSTCVAACCAQSTKDHLIYASRFMPWYVKCEWFSGLICFFHPTKKRPEKESNTQNNSQNKKSALGWRNGKRFECKNHGIHTHSHMIPPISLVNCEKCSTQWVVIIYEVRSISSTVSMELIVEKLSVS